MGQNIIFVRKCIHDKLINEVFSEKGGANFSRFSGNDIEKAFDMYDSEIFNKQIRNKLQENGSLLRFFASNRTSGTAGMCNIICESKGFYEYHLDIAPNIVKEKRNQLEELIDLETIDRVYCFQIIIEHQLIHLVMILWGYLHMEPSNIYDVYGMLYKDMLYNYFGYILNPKLDLSYISEYNNTIIRKKIVESSFVLRKNNFVDFKGYTSEIGLMRNWSNSCYIDSLLTCLFMGTSNAPRDYILNTDISKIDYKSWSSEEISKDIHKRKNKVFKEIRGIQELDTEEKTKNYVQILQNSLLLDYDKMVNKKSIFKCMDTRMILANSIPDMGRNGRKGVQNLCSYPVGDLYEIIVDLFPGLKMWYIPTLITSEKSGKSNEPSITEERKSFLFWDFVGPPDNEGSTPIWDAIDSPMLVFQNGLIPPIENYGSKRSEKLIVRGPIPGKFNNIKEITPKGDIIEKSIPKIGNITQTIKKNRVFNEYIINKNYRLFATVRNHGFKPTTSGIDDFGGGHYTAYVRPFFDSEKWYTYDDIGPKWDVTHKGCNNEGKLPADTFKDSYFSRSELLFYEKIKENHTDSDTSSPAKINSEIWKGRCIRVKIIYKMHGYAIMFVTDVSPLKNFVKTIISLKPKYTTKVTDEIYMWRDNSDIIKGIFKKIKKLDKSFEFDF